MNWIFLFIACGDSTSTSKTVAPDLEPLSLVDVSPAEISAEGGDRVVLEGSGFQEDSVLRINGVDCVSTFFASDRQMACVTPPADVGEGVVSITRVSDQATTELPISVREMTDSPSGGDTADQFSDTGAPGEDTDADSQEEEVLTVLVDYCHLQWPCSMELEASQTSEEVYSWVFLSGTTDQSGAGESIQVAVGVGSEDVDPSTGWAWSDCVYNTDTDGLTPGDLANDEFKGTFQAPSTAGAYRYAARARVGDGPWTLCDFGESCGGAGSDDGFDIAATGVLTVVEP